MWYPCILNDMVPSDACHLHTLCPWMRAPGTSNREKKWVKNEDFTENACPRTFNKTGYIWKTEKSRVCCKIQSNLTLKSYLLNPKTLYILDDRMPPYILRCNVASYHIVKADQIASS